MTDTSATKHFDQDAALARLREFQHSIQDAGGVIGADEAIELAATFEQLDDWLAAGGTHPAAWSGSLDDLTISDACQQGECGDCVRLHGIGPCEHDCHYEENDETEVNADGIRG